MRTVTVLQLMTRARERADAVGDTTWIPDTELQKLVDAAYTDLVDQLVKAEIHQFETTSTITTTGAASYAVPADFYKALAIDYLYATDRYVEVPQLTFAERNRFTGIYNQPTASYASGWRLVSGNIVFSPTPPTGQTYKLTYVPAPANISAVATSTAVDGIAGWDEFIVIHTALNMCTKEDGPEVANLSRALDEMRGRIAQMGVDRSPVMAIADTRCEYDTWEMPGRRRWP